MNNKIRDILGQRDDAADPDAAEAPDDGVYRAFIANRNGRPTMGFYIAHKDGNLDGFLYHGINHPKFQIRDREEFVSFTYSGTAAVMTGKKLRGIFDALMRHTLVSIHEYDGRKVADDAPIVTRISVKQAGPVRSDAGLELVKTAKQAS
jgi:hypothetical protein